MIPGRTASHAAVTAASGSVAEGSTTPIRESPSGARSTTTGPSTVMDQSLGAVKVAPPAVVRGVSLASFSGAGFEDAAVGGAGRGGAWAVATPPSATTTRNNETSVRFIVTPAFRHPDQVARPSAPSAGVHPRGSVEHKVTPRTSPTDQYFSRPHRRPERQVQAHGRRNGIEQRWESDVRLPRHVHVPGSMTGETRAATKSRPHASAASLRHRRPLSEHSTNGLHEYVEPLSRVLAPVPRQRLEHRLSHGA